MTSKSKRAKKDKPKKTTDESEYDIDHIMEYQTLGLEDFLEAEEQGRWA